MSAMEDKLEPIAVVGMSCRFPGAADTPAGFWELLSRGESAWSKVPEDRFNIDAYYHPSSEREGAVITNSGYFMKEDVSKYDASFFSMTAAEAAGTDPQQRLLMEITYEALENAGISMKDIAGTPTSCHVGAFGNDYQITSTGQIWDTSLYQATGNGMSMLSNRLSWFFDLRGASMTIDTACSSSLVALHLGVQGLRNGDSNVAIVGGVSMILQPEPMRGLSALHFLSPDGKCHSFDASANGYARGEGIGMMVLKPLSDALRDNDTIRAVIRGSGLNQDGKTPGITMPSRDAQSDLIHKTYAAAGLKFDRTGYFEAHGTGTAIGDPIELSGIGDSIGANRDPENPIYVGSVKTNLGHLEASAGVAGVMKAILAMENGKIPQVVGLETVNPRLLLDDWKVKLNTELVPWPTSGLRRVSVNSFGYGGANAHLIMDDAKHYLEEHGLRGHHSTVGSLDGSSLDEDSDSGVSVGTPSSTSSHSYPYKPSFSSPKLLVLSSPEQGGTARLADTYSKYIEKRNASASSADCDIPGLKGLQEAAYIEDLAYTLGKRRSAFDWRTFAVASTTDEFQTAVKRGLPKLRRAARAPACAYVFTGQGSQYFNMGRELQSHAVFRKSLQAADEYLAALGSGWSVLEEINKPEETSRINDAELSQPLCTVLQVAIVDLLRHWGLSAKAVVGHSSGEIGAAYAAGALSQRDAWKVAYFRGLFSGNLPTAQPQLSGTMMAVALSETIAQDYAAKATTGKVVVACINSPSSVTLSGDMIAIDEVEDFLKADDIWCRKLKVKTAYHSHHMNFIAKEYLKSIEDIEPLETDGSVTMFSSVTGQQVASADLGASYWVENMLSPVRFSTAVAALLSPTDARSRRQKTPNVQSLIEIGPHGVLKGPLNQILSASVDGYEKSVSYISVLHRGNDALRMAVETAGKLWGAGHDLSLSLVNTTDDNSKPHKVLTDLPPYPWNHERSHWHESRQNLFRRLPPGPRTDLLGYAVDGWNPLVPDPRWCNMLKPSEIPWVMDHVISGQVVLPGAAMICMAIEACQKIVDPSKTVEGFEFRDINFTRALIFQTFESTMEVAMQFRPQTLGTKASTFVWHKFAMTSIARDNLSTEHCNGLVRIKYKTKSSEIEKGIEAAAELETIKKTYAEVSAACTKEVNTTIMYNDVANDGMQFGPIFRLLTEMRGGVDVGVATLTIPDTASIMPESYEYPLLLHPAVLDAAFQVMFSRSALSDTSTGTLSVISSIGSLYVSADIPNAPGSALRSYQKSVKTGYRDVVGQIVIADQEFNSPFIVLKNVVSTGLAKEESKTDMAVATMLCTRLDWKEDVNALSQLVAPLLNANIAPFEADVLTNVNQLEQAAQIYIQRALVALDVNPETSLAPIPAAEWIRQLLNHETKVIAAEEDDAALTTSIESSSLGKVLQAIGSKLVDILNGSTDIAKILLEEELGELSLFTDKLLGKELINSQIAAWFDIAGYKNPDLHILEIGNGSVSTSVSILDTLSSKKATGPRYGQYTFTDPDSSRIDNIKALLKKFANVDVQTLNIERDLATQNLKTQKYDVIVVNDMLRAVSNINFALQNLKRLLKPGGKLIIGALSKLTSRTAMVLGLAEDWWVQQSEGKPQMRTLSEADWSKYLTSNGMATPEISIDDSLLENVHQMSIMVSTFAKESVKSTEEIVLLVPAEATPNSIVLAGNIEQELVQRGLAVSKTTLGSLPEPGDKIFISLLELENTLVESIDEEDFNSLKALVTKSSGVLWMTRGGVKSGLALPGQFAVIGLFRTILSEVPHLRLFNLDLSLSLDLTSSRASSLIVELFNNSFSEEEDVVIDHEYAEDNGIVYIPRLLQEESMNSSLTERNEAPAPEMAKLFQPDRPLKMRLGEVGLLDTFRFVDRPEYDAPLAPKSVNIKVLATGLNFVDVMAALGYVPSVALGAEFAGIITALGSEVPETAYHVGQIVVGSTEDCFATQVRVHWKTIQAVPEGMSPEAAATCVIAYTTAYFALYDNGRLKKGDTILIHSAAGGLGQAAVQLALHIGAIVYCTVGSVHKKELLMERYGIPENHIFNSRDTTFAQGVMRETKGRGVDVVLNSTFGEMLRASWNCVADFGIFVEVGKRDILSNNMLEMAPFIRGCTFSAFNLAQYTEDCEPHRLDACNDTVAKVFKLLGDGHIQPPTPLHVMSITESEEAFRALQSGKFAGKIVLKLNDEDIVPVMPEKQLPLDMDPNATYLLAGGLGGIGRSLADLMAEHGAKYIAFISKSGDSKQESRTYLEALREKGVHAIAYACDVTDREALEKTLVQCEAEMPKIKGFVNCAMMLKDAIFENMTHSDWVAATGPKIQGSWNMHELLPIDMDFFIMLSSTSGIIGNPGQANYAAGNTFQNGLAHFRRRKGLKATSIDLSAVAGVGYLAENAEAYETRKTLMKMQIKEDEIHHIFLAAIAGATKKDHEMPPQLTTGIIGGEVLRSLMPGCSWARDSKFILLRKADGQSGTASGGSDPTREAFMASESLAEAAGIVETALVARLAKALFISPEDINVEQPLHAYGVDSLIAVEVRNWVLKELKSDISILDILSPVPIHGLSLKISEGSKILPMALRLEVAEVKKEAGVATTAANNTQAEGEVDTAAIVEEEAKSKGSGSTTPTNIVAGQGKPLVLLAARDASLEIEVAKGESGIRVTVAVQEVL